jgi:uncharacterized protein Usg
MKIEVYFVEDEDFDIVLGVWTTDTYLEYYIPDFNILISQYEKDDYDIMEMKEYSVLFQSGNYTRKSTYLGDL